MTAKIVNLKSNEENKKIIEQLEYALELVKEEQIDNCAILMVKKDNSVVQSWSNSKGIFSLIGALESLKVDLIDNCIE